MKSKRSKGLIDREWESIRHFPGVFAKGSDAEDALLGRRKMQQTQTPFPNFQISGLLTNAGFASQKSFDPTHFAIPTQVKGELAQYFDFATLIELDRRLRWLRCYLTQKNNPYDRENIVFVDENEKQIPKLKKGKKQSWLYETEFEGTSIEPAFDPIDFLFNTSSPLSDIWYAAKCLAHNRRAATLEKEYGTNPELAVLGLSREWMLFGETWAEARAVLNFGDDVLRGIKTKKAAALGGASRRSSKEPGTKKILREMRQFIIANPSVRNAARLTYERGFGKSSEANRRAWYRHPEKKL